MSPGQRGENVPYSREDLQDAKQVAEELGGIKVGLDSLGRSVDLLRTDIKTLTDGQTQVAANRSSVTWLWRMVAILFTGMLALGGMMWKK